jgi:Mn2+/Fe2+ NRAMP family transporter
MKKTKSLAVSAALGFVIVIAIMLFSIYLDKVNITGAAVAADSIGNFRTAAVIILALIVMGFVMFFYSKKR